MNWLTGAIQKNYILCISSSILLILIWLWKKRRVDLNCWFCGCISSVSILDQKWWHCNTCSQYNGFTEDGDYNKPIEEMYKQPSSSLYQYCVPEPFMARNSLLCLSCQSNQSKKVYETSLFEPFDEENFLKECEEYEQFLERKYRLCLSCRTAVDYYLSEEQHRVNQMNAQGAMGKSTSVILKQSKIIEKKKYIHPRLRILLKCTIWLLSLAMFGWFNISGRISKLDIILSIPLVLSLYFCVGKIFKTLLGSMLALLIWCLVSFADIITSKSVSYNFPAKVIPSVALLCIIDIVFNATKYFLKREQARSLQKKKQIDGIVNFEDFDENESIKDQHFDKHLFRSKQPPNTTNGDGIREDEDKESRNIVKADEVRSTDPTTPDLLEGHMNAMFIGSRRLSNETEQKRSKKSEKNHVIAALKYQYNPSSLRNGPLIKPATFLINNQQTLNERHESSELKKKHEQKIFEDYEKIDNIQVAAESTSGSKWYNRVSWATLKWHNRLSWTLLMQVFLVLSVTMNVYLVLRT